MAEMQRNVTGRTLKIREQVHSALTDYIIMIVTVLIFLLFAVALRNKGFLTAANIMNIFTQSSVIAIMAVASVFILAAGEIDLALGMTVGLAALISALGAREFGFIGGIIGGLGTGLVVGLIHGFFVVKLKVPAFLVTIATMSVFQGLARWVTQLQAVPVTNTAFCDIFGGLRFWGNKLSILFIWAIVISIIGHVVLTKTSFGKKVLAVGGNKTAALFSGVNTDRIRFSVFIIVALAAALAGMLYSGRMASARYFYGNNDLFIVIAAVIIGGNSIYGGKGTIVGAIIGSLILGMINNGLLLWGFGVDQQIIFRGLIILVAVIISAERD